MKCKDGIFRRKFVSGNSCYGTTIFNKMDSYGEESKVWRLYNYAGDIIYEEQVWKIGKDDGWRDVTEYKFDATSLEWIKVK